MTRNQDRLFGPGSIVLLALMGLGLVVAVIRYVFGLGAISNLSDAYPWGIWISFDLFCGVALAAGAFVVAATVHIFGGETMRPLLRPAILTGFLGYSSAGDKAHGNPALATTIGCYICHSGVVSSTKIDTYAMNGTTSKFRCANCHDAGSPTPLQVGEIVNTAQHINGSKNVAFAPVSFKTKAQLSNVANALGWTRTGSYKTAGSHDSFDMSVSTWNPATKTCLTACHVNQPGIVWGASLQCASCHANQ